MDGRVPYDNDTESAWLQGLHDDLFKSKEAEQLRMSNYERVEDLGHRENERNHQKGKGQYLCKAEEIGL
jgi:hypothetical protein